MNTKRQLLTSERTAEEELARRILDYLERHPKAEDTLEGITYWWLLEQQVWIESTRVNTALGRLVKRGCVTSHRRTDGTIYYRRSTL